MPEQNWNLWERFLTLSRESDKHPSYEGYGHDRRVWDIMESTLSELSMDHWQLPDIVKQTDTWNHLSDYQNARMGESFILFRLLELLLVRVKIVFELIAPDLQPKTIRLLTEIEGPFPTTYHELHRSFATRFPNTWKKARPQIAWIPLGIRLTEFGAKGNAEIHAARSVSSADVDPVRSLYFLPGSVSFRMEKDDGTSDRFRSSRVAYELLAIKSKCSDVQPLATAHSNTVLSILYDGKPPFEPYHLSPDSDDAAKIADTSKQVEENLSKGSRASESETIRREPANGNCGAPQFKKNPPFGDRVSIDVKNAVNTFMADWHQGLDKGEWCRIYCEKIKRPDWNLRKILYDYLKFSDS